jgi:Protein of unknown function (DUF4230)
MAHLAQRTRSPQAAQPLPGRETGPARPGRRRRLAVLAAAAAAVVAVPVAYQGLGGLPGLPNPFAEQVLDRSTTPLLTALRDLEEFHAATGTFQVVIDQEKDTPFVPSVISGERTTFLATGDVDALVDFSRLGADRVRVSADRRSVSISLPPATLGEASLDTSESRVLGRDRGVLDRVGSALSDNPSDDSPLYQLGERRLSEAAADSDLLERAEDNTRDTLTALARSLGFEQVTITFDAPPADAGL